MPSQDRGQPIEERSNECVHSRAIAANHLVLLRWAPKGAGLRDVRGGVRFFSMTTPNKLALVAACAGDPARASMLDALVDGRAFTAGELSSVARITPLVGALDE